MSRKPTLYALICEDMSGLGMQGSTSTTNWRRYFTTAAKAKKYAAAHFNVGNETRKLQWEKTEDGWTTGDMSYVMYEVKKLKVLE